MIQTVELLPGITLRCFQDTRFKQEGLSIQLVRPMDKIEAAYNALLPAVLLRGCETATDLQAITLRLDDLYGAALGQLLRRIGDYQSTGLSCSFVKEAYALDGDRILAPMLGFIEELLLRPKLEKGVFSRDFVESEKRNLIATIDSLQNDKRAYANAQMLKLMCKGDSYGIPRLGNKETVETITPESLYAHYRKILKESPMHLFYIGATEPERMGDLLRPIFEKLDRDPVALPPQTAFSDLGGGEQIEEMDVAQGKLCMGFVTPVTLRDADFVPMQILNAVFGGGMISKLFMKVREEQSLCYDIGSSYHGSKGIMTVSAGIDSNMDIPVRQEILKQLEACQKGQISHEELEAAKQSLLSQIKSTHDSPGAIEGYYATAALSGLCLTPEDYAKAVEQTTLEDVVRVARQVKLHTVYFLRGAV